MALWGKADAIYSPGTVDVDLDNGTITGTGTTFTRASVGDVILIGAGATYGRAIISGITSNTFIAIASTQFLTPNAGYAITGVGYTISQEPKYTLHDSRWGANDIFGIDEYEIGVAATTTKYALTHAGWVGIQTYNDNEGNLRVKSEVLVAMSGITTGTVGAAQTQGDANDNSFGEFVYKP
jgi:hypothetical protein